MKLTLVTIVTAHLEPMRTFYQAVLQIEPQIYRGNYVEFPLETGTLALWRQSECATFGLSALRGAANDRVLIELEVADVDAEYARLRGLQVDVIQEPRTQPWGQRTCYVRDPDGNVLTVYTAVEEETR
jgi:catechol 2,3-dioxygenase-like lactoylglutathione lyase family enzyme